MNQPGNSFLSVMTHRTHLLTLLWLMVTIRMEHMWLCTCPFGIWSLLMSHVQPLVLPFHSFPVASHFKPNTWSPSLGNLTARGFLEPPLGPPAPYLHGQDLAFCLVAPTPDGTGLSYLLLPNGANPERYVQKHLHVNVCSSVHHMQRAVDSRGVRYVISTISASFLREEF